MAMQRKDWHNLEGLLIAWLTAGSLDLLAAFASAAMNSVTPMAVLRAIASGFIGSAAHNKVHGVALIAGLGIAVHFAIMLAIVLVFWILKEFFETLLERATFAGMVYGVVVFLVMNFVVLPNSAITFTPDHSATGLVSGIAIHILCVGLPISFAAHHFSNPKSR